MSVATPAISRLRQRMIEDMRMRKLSDKTQSHYIRAVRQFAVGKRQPMAHSCTEPFERQLRSDNGLSRCDRERRIVGGSSPTPYQYQRPAKLVLIVHPLLFRRDLLAPVHVFDHALAQRADGRPRD